MPVLRAKPPILLRHVAFLVALLLGGCAVSPQAPVVEESLPPLAREARAAMAAGEPARAAQAWIQAARLHPEQAADFLLAAADAWLRAEDPDRARETLAGLDHLQLTPAQEARKGLLLARIAEAQHEPQAILEALAFDPRHLPEPDRALFHRLRAEAFLETGNSLESARERVALDALLRDETARQDNELALWEALNHLSTHALELLENTDTLGGWIALTRILRQHAANPETLAQALEAWRRQWPEHPAGRGFLERLQERRRNLIAHRPRHIAALLPLSGRLARAGEAVRDGMIAAYYRLVTEDPELVIDFLDTGGDPNRIWPLYLQAQQQGADFVIGPLQRSSVNTLFRSGELAIPVLALNRIPEPEEGTPPLPPAGFYQFPLAPEDEAVAVAEHAARRGYLRSLALLPEGKRGQRLLGAYLAKWSALDSGHRLLEAGSYPPVPKQLSGVVSRLLNIDSSRHRYQRLVRTLGLRPEFEPRPRKDADHVFLVANPVMGRLLKPLLRFHRASRLPVLATSSIYSGHPDPELDRDLDGIEFCDIPWLIAPADTMKHDRDLLEGSRRLPGSLLRLTALGYDALTLAPLLPALQAGLLPSHAGATGRLHLDANGRISRQLAWARMTQGLPRPLPPYDSESMTNAHGGAPDEETHAPDPPPGYRGRTDRLSVPEPPGAPTPGPQRSQSLR